jgi:hypothetical protein
MAAAEVVGKRSPGILFPRGPYCPIKGCMPPGRSPETRVRRGGLARCGGARGGEEQLGEDRDVLNGYDFNRNYFF